MNAELGSVHALILILGFLGTVPLAQAGSLDDPEMSCPANDVRTIPMGPGVAATPVEQAVDIVAVWFDNETVESIQVNVFLQDMGLLSGPTSSQAVTTYIVNFDSSNVQNSVDEEFAWEVRGTFAGGTADPWRFYFAPTNGDHVEISGEAKGDMNIVRWTVPRPFLGEPQQGDLLTPILAQAWYGTPYPVDGPRDACDEESRSMTLDKEVGGSAEPATQPAGGPGQASPPVAGIVGVATLLLLTRLRRRQVPS